jgi:uncharacterized protein (DUF433 family)
MAARHRLRTGLAVTGLHALDGARHLRDAQQADSVLCRLVAHYSCAIIEAEERGLAGVLSREFAPAPGVLSSALIYCDMTTSPDRELVPAEKRIAEIDQRYGSGHLVSRSIQRATPMILRAVEQVHRTAARTAQGLRMDEHPLIRFADGPAGRRARLVGTGKDVWEIIAAVHDNDGDAAETARYLELPLGLVQAAISYYGAYRDEIDQWIEANEQQAAEAYAAWSAGQDAVRQ